MLPRHPVPSIVSFGYGQRGERTTGATTRQAERRRGRIGVPGAASAGSGELTVNVNPGVLVPVLRIADVKLIQNRAENNLL